MPAALGSPATDTTKARPDIVGCGPLASAAQALGLRPWLAALPLRERRLRARLLIVGFSLVLPVSYPCGHEDLILPHQPGPTQFGGAVPPPTLKSSYRSAQELVGSTSVRPLSLAL